MERVCDAYPHKNSWAKYEWSTILPAHLTEGKNTWNRKRYVNKIGKTNPYRCHFCIFLSPPGETRHPPVVVLNAGSRMCCALTSALTPGWKLRPLLLPKQEKISIIVITLSLHKTSALLLRIILIIAFISKMLPENLTSLEINPIHMYKLHSARKANYLNNMQIK